MPKALKATAGCPLTPAQFKCMALVACGFTRREVAELLGCRYSTVRQHLVQGRLRLGANTVEQAIVEVALRWLQTPRSGQQHYMDNFDRHLAEILARANRPVRVPSNGPLNDLIQDALVLTSNDSA